METDSDSLVLLGVAGDELEANIWRDILEQEGIVALVKNTEPLSSYGAPPLMRGLHVYIRAGDESRARWLLGEGHSPG